MIFTVPMSGSEVAKSKTEMHITNAASEVMWSCNVTTIEHEGVQIVSVLKGTLDVPALNYVTSLSICYFVWQRLSGDHADGR